MCFTTFDFIAIWINNLMATFFEWVFFPLTVICRERHSLWSPFHPFEISTLISNLNILSLIHLDLVKTSIFKRNKSTLLSVCSWSAALKSGFSSFLIGFISIATFLRNCCDFHSNSLHSLLSMYHITQLIRVLYFCSLIWILGRSIFFMKRKPTF